MVSDYTYTTVGAAFYPNALSETFHPLVYPYLMFTIHKSLESYSETTILLRLSRLLFLPSLLDRLAVQLITTQASPALSVMVEKASSSNRQAKHPTAPK